MSVKLTAVVFILMSIHGCSSNANPEPGLQQPGSATRLYSPLLDAETPEPCETNCQLFLRGSEWRLIRYQDSDDQEIAVTGENLYTLLFSEVDDRVTGLFACNTLVAHHTIQPQPDGGSESEKATLSNATVGIHDCQTVGLAASEYRFVSEFMTAGDVAVRTGGSLMYLENALGQKLTYRGRLDALDGEYRSFRTLASGDYLPFTEINDQSADILVYESRSDFDSTSSELTGVLDEVQMPVDFDTETLIGLFLGKLNYLGPDITIEQVIERENEIEVQTFSGLFWCDDGTGQPRGENAPYRLSALNVVGKPVNVRSIASSACP